MIDHLKTTKILAVEAANSIPSSTDLQVIELENLANCDIFKDNLRSGDINQSTTIRSLIGLNTNFFYSVECVPNASSKKCSLDGCVYERGIGYLYEQGEHVYLKRLLPIINQYSDGSTLHSTHGPQRFKCCDDESTVVITSIVPPSYLEALVVPYSVLVSDKDSFVPTPVQIKPNSFLARLNDSIQSLAFDSEYFIDIITSIITKFSKQLKLKTSKLCVKRIETDIIDIKPSDNQKAVKGSLVYDNENNTLKFYDGENWRTISFVD